MNNSPFDRAVEDKAQHHCESCRWMRERTDKDTKVEAGYDHARHWCAKNDMPTLALASRCGGDDWESKPTPLEEKCDAEALGKELDRFEKRHGAGATTLWLVGELVRVQKKGTIRRADYQGDDFKVTIAVKKNLRA